MTPRTAPTLGAPLRIAFVVQGEGRGHMTQALALAEMLRSAGHSVVKVLLGRSRVRGVPEYFADSIGAPVETFLAPMLVPRPDGRAVSTPATALGATLRLPAYAASTHAIARGLRAADADVVVNFYDLLTAFSRLLFGAQTPSVSVAHNYLYLHECTRPLPGGPAGRFGYWLLSRTSMMRSGTRVALSYAPERTDGDLGIRVAPPLLRASLRAAVPTAGEELLAYAVNPGYANDLAAWHRSRDGAPDLRCFVEGGARVLTSPPHPGFHIHELDDRAFLEYMAACRAYIGSAGFESLCEAFYLGKPVLAVPTEGHVEQGLNAWDASRRGVAVRGTYHDLDAFLAAPPRPDPDAVHAFRAWVAQAPAHHVAAVEDAAYNPRNQPGATGHPRGGS